MNLLSSLSPFFLDWLDLIVRWFHIIVGIAWIGTSFYFNWLDSKLDRNIDEENIEGELWSVHSGGFYNINKLKGPPKEFPKELHWFKWEAYSTWLSGFILLVIVYYLNSESLLIDRSVLIINTWQAIIISLFFLFGSWFVYNFLCNSKLINNSIVFTSTCFILAIFICFILTHIFGSRAAYIHVGACLGTIMAANVFRVIIPSQKNMVDSALNNQKPNLQMGINAKNRSMHNNYITLPVVFIMISAHYPFTYGHEYNWLILVIISLSGALIRHYFNLRNKRKYKFWILPVAFSLMISLFFFTSLPKLYFNNINYIKNNEDVKFNEVKNIIKYRCGVCHAKNPTFEGLPSAPLGIIYDNENDILMNISKIKEQALDSDIMPPGNITGITKHERNKLRLWIKQGSKTNN